LPIAPSVPSTGIRRQGSPLVRSLNCFDSRTGRGFRTSIRWTPWRAARAELRVVAQVLVEPGDDVQAPLDRVPYDPSELGWDVPTERRDADHEALRSASLDRLIEARDDRDAVRAAVQDIARIPARLRSVDHGGDLVPLRISHEAVRGLSRALAKIAVAQDHGPLHRTNPS